MNKMKFTRSVFIAISAVLAVSNAGSKKPAETTKGQAASAQKPAIWTAEPKGFMGVEFGIPIDEQIPRCPTFGSPGLFDSVDASKTTQLGKLCYSKLGREFVELHNFPQVGVDIGRPMVSMVGNAPEAVHLTPPHYDWPKMLELLKARFGEPTSATSNSYSTRGGATVSGSVFTWKGETVTLTFSEYGSSIDESSVRIFTTRFLEGKRQQDKANALENKDKL